MEREARVETGHYERYGGTRAFAIRFGRDAEARHSARRADRACSTSGDAADEVVRRDRAGIAVKGFPQRGA